MYPVGEETERVRIGTAEREDALQLLGKQFAEGRLTPEEFSERSAAVSAALTRADLQPIFADLPVTPVAGAEHTRDWRAIAMAVIPLIALGFTMLVPHGWLAWLALPVVGMLLYGRRS